MTFQLGTVSPAVSVAYRFALASALLLAYCALRGIRLGFSAREHAWFALQGALQSAVFVCVYVSVGHMPSGLVAIIFSFTAVLNIVGAYLFFRVPLRARILMGAVFGVSGVLLIFVPLAAPAGDFGMPLRGVMIASVGTMAGSLYSMATFASQSRGISPIQVNGFATLYCAIFAGLYAVGTGEQFGFDWRASYVLSLAYLSIAGTALVFLAYLELNKQVGPDRAGYVAVAVPVVALLISTLFERLPWQALTIVGLASCVAGNLLVLQDAARPVNKPIRATETNPRK